MAKDSGSSPHARPTISRLSSAAHPPAANLASRRQGACEGSSARSWQRARTETSRHSRQRERFRFLRHGKGSHCGMMARPE